MKKFLLLVFSFICVTINVNAQIQPVFNYGTNGKIIANPTMIDSFFVDHDNESTNHYHQVKEVQTFIGKDSYVVKLMRFDTWGEDPGDYHVIEIMLNSKEVLKLKDQDGWDFFYLATNHKRDTINPVRIIELSPDYKALIFTGIAISSQPPVITIVTIGKGKATLVYNKPAYINDIKTYDDSTVYELQLNTIEYNMDYIPYNDPELARLIFKNGMIFYKDMSNPEEYDLKELEPRF